MHESTGMLAFPEYEGENFRRRVVIFVPVGKWELAREEATERTGVKTSVTTLVASEICIRMGISLGASIRISSAQRVRLSCGPGKPRSRVRIVRSWDQAQTDLVEGPQKSLGAFGCGVEVWNLSRLPGHHTLPGRFVGLLLQGCCCHP